MSTDAPMTVPEPVLELCERLAQAGHRAWVVGGCVRDSLRGVAVADWDLATDATPDQVMKVFRRTVPTGIEHGTVTVLHRGGHYEVTTLRGEGAYSDGRRPDDVRFVSSIDDDLARRDFTVNAIAYDPRARRFEDPWGGRDDLAHRVLRAVRDPHERFGEDGLRALRAARFVATLEFALDEATEAAIPATLETLRRVSRERVRDEWAKAFTKAARPSLAFDVMRRTGMLEVHAPALAALDGPTFTRAIRRLDACPRGVAVRLAALVFDLAPAPDAWMREMRFSNEEREHATHLCRTARVDGCEAWSDAEVRRFLQRATRDRGLDVLALARADRIARTESADTVDALEARCRAEIRRGIALTTSELAIGGREVMAALGARPGRQVGQVLDALLAIVLDDPERNERDALVAEIPAIAARLGGP